MLNYRVETTVFAWWLIAFPPTFTQAKRSLLWLQPGNGRQALGCSWLSSVFCLCWTHSDTPLVKSKVLKAICFHLKPAKAVLSSQHTCWGRLLCRQSSRLSLCFSVGAAGPVAPTQISEKEKHKTFQTSALKPAVLPVSQLHHPVLSLIGPYQSHVDTQICSHSPTCRTGASICHAHIINQFISFNLGLVSKLLLTLPSIICVNEVPDCGLTFMWRAAARWGWFSWAINSLGTPHNQ